MHFYKLGYWTYDGEASIGLVHERRISREAFEAQVHEATAEVVRREKDRKDHFPFAWIYDDVARELETRHGYRRIEYAAEFEPFGSNSILIEDEAWPDLCRLTQFLQAEGLAPPAPEDRA